MKVVICYGSPEWDISDLAIRQYCEMKGLTDENSVERTEMEEALKKAGTYQGTLKQDNAGE